MNYGNIKINIIIKTETRVISCQQTNMVSFILEKVQVIALHLIKTQPVEHAL